MSLSDDQLIEAVRNRTLPAEAFKHAQHVHLAWICLRRAPLLSALAEFKRLLLDFAAHHGKPGLYHETITLAYLLLVYERMAQSPAIMEWERFKEEHADLMSFRNGPFFEYYDAEVLTDPLARLCFVLPLPRAPTCCRSRGDGPSARSDRATPGAGW
jgi:hypothetical protein